MISSKRQLPDQNHYSASLSEFKKTLLPAVKDSKTVSEIAKRIQKVDEWRAFFNAAYLRSRHQIRKGYGRGYRTLLSLMVIVDVKIVKDWAQNTAGTHLKEVCQPILAYEPRDSILISYIQVLQRGSVLAVQSPVQKALLNSGLVTLERGSAESCQCHLCKGIRFGLGRNFATWYYPACLYCF